MLRCRQLPQAGAKGTPLARLCHFLWHLFLPRDGMAVVYGVPADSPRIWLTYLWRPSGGGEDKVRGREAESPGPLVSLSQKRP
jgi:hypothetical protein